jgi:hypothetical protein
MNLFLIILPRSYSFVINKGINYIFQVIAAVHNLKHEYRLKLNRPIISGIQNFTYAVIQRVLCYEQTTA